MTSPEGGRAPSIVFRDRRLRKPSLVTLRPPRKGEWHRAPTAPDDGRHAVPVGRGARGWILIADCRRAARASGRADVVGRTLRGSRPSITRLRLPPPKGLQAGSNHHADLAAARSPMWPDSASGWRRRGRHGQKSILAAPSAAAGDPRFVAIQASRGTEGSANQREKPRPVGRGSITFVPLGSSLRCQPPPVRDSQRQTLLERARGRATGLAVEPLRAPEIRAPAASVRGSISPVAGPLVQAPYASARLQVGR